MQLFRDRIVERFTRRFGYRQDADSLFDKLHSLATRAAATDAAHRRTSCPDLACLADEVIPHILSLACGVAHHGHHGLKLLFYQSFDFCAIRNSCRRRTDVARTRQPRNFSAGTNRTGYQALPILFFVILDARKPTFKRMAVGAAKVKNLDCHEV